MRTTTSVFLLLSVGFAAVFISCSRLSRDTPMLSHQDSIVGHTLFKLIPADTSGITFTNTITENDRINMIDYFNLYNGGGVSIGDVNNDGLADVFLTGNQVPGTLYLNLGNLKFKDVTRTAGIVTTGWCTGATMADINNDGFLDIYVCRAGNDDDATRKTNLLYISKGLDATGTPIFHEQASTVGLAYNGFSTQASFFDYDKDGDLDVYLLNTNNESRVSTRLMPVRPNSKAVSTDKLYRNDTRTVNGKWYGMFTDVSAAAGIVYEGLGLGIGVNDFNNDGWEDLYISNDFIGNDHLYINNRNGTFSERSGEFLKHQSSAAMGNDIADINNDGWADIMVVDMLPPTHENRKRMGAPVKFEQFQMALAAGYHPQYMRNTLQLNNGFVDDASDAVSFSEIGQLAGVHSTDWSWAPLLADFDNDGWKDLIITNGYRHDITDLDFVSYGTRLISNQSGVQQAEQIIKQQARQMPAVKRINYAFKNKGDLTFDDASMRWGFTQPSFSNGVAYGDLDNDGDLDLVINNIDEPAFVYENTTNANRNQHYLSIKLKGSTANGFGLGSTVKIFCKGQLQTHHQQVSRGFQSSVDYTIHFGTGKNTTIDSLLITWPDSRVQKLVSVKANQLLVLDHKNSSRIIKSSSSKEEPFLFSAAAKHAISFIHKEDRYNDFARQFLLPHQHSRLGPGIAVGDVNGDKLDDFIVAGAYKQSAQIFIQNHHQKFTSYPLTNSASKYHEEMGMLLFDADGDGDLDLYSVTGSNEFAPGSEDYRDKLYVNNGAGKFTLMPGALPSIKASGSCVTACDYDQDGDLDLFVGGRLAPMNFPMPGESVLLRNDTPRGSDAKSILFTDVTDTDAPGLQNAGMVTTALFTDFDQDNITDLIVAGEFMPVRFFKNINKKFVEVKSSTGLPQHNVGWWNSLGSADFDNDGDVDYIVGNTGLNTSYKVSETQPVSVYAADFDGNGSLDPILTHYLMGQEYPAHSRDDMIRQMIGTRRKFKLYADYAKAKIHDVVSSDDLKNAYTVRATRFESVYIENLGNGKFNMKPLPIRAQLFPVFGIQCTDGNSDGFMDVLLTGNSYAPDVMSGRYDAGIGLMLLGDGKGNFKETTPQHSGFYIDGDAKALAMLLLKDGDPLWLATQNDGPLKAFRFTHSKKSSIIALQHDDAFAEVIFANGSKRRQEFYYGDSYLSQSSRQFIVPANATSITFHTYSGKSRTVTFNMIVKK